MFRLLTNAGALGFATVHPKDIDTSKLWTIDLNIYTTALFKLPGGPVGFAFGGQFRRENIEQDPDTLNLEGDIIGSSALRSRTLDARITHSMLRLTFRSSAPKWESRYSTRWNSQRRCVLKTSATMIQTSWCRSLECGGSPSTINSLFVRPGAKVSVSHRSSNCSRHQPQDCYRRRSWAPPSRKQPQSPRATQIWQPEDSRAFSAGIVYTPKYVNGLTLSIDMWDIERYGVVTAPIAQEVVNRFVTGTLLPGEVVILDPSGTSVNAIFDTFQNAGRQNARGIDLGAQYQNQTSYGTFTWYTQATYLDSFIFQSTRRVKAAKLAVTPLAESAATAT